VENNKISSIKSIQRIGQKAGLPLISVFSFFSIHKPKKPDPEIGLLTIPMIPCSQDTLLVTCRTDQIRFLSPRFPVMTMVASCSLVSPRVRHSPTFLPFFRMATLSATASTSSMLWLIIRTVTP